TEHDVAGAVERELARAGRAASAELGERCAVDVDLFGPVAAITAVGAHALVVAAGGWDSLARGKKAASRCVPRGPHVPAPNLRGAVAIQRQGFVNCYHFMIDARGNVEDRSRGGRVDQALE